MGQYLPSPSTNKEKEDKETENLRYGICNIQGWKRNLDNTFISKITLETNFDYFIFGIFCGNNGPEVSHILKKYFIQTLVRNENLDPENIPQNLKETFSKINELLKNSYKIDLEQFRKEYNEVNKEIIEDEKITDYTGCTACILLINETTKKIICANIGNSQIILCNEKESKILFPAKHHPDDENEKKRIENSNGWISDGKIMGWLNVSRSFGNFGYNNEFSVFNTEGEIVSAVPDIFEITLKEEEFIFIINDEVCINKDDFYSKYIKAEIEEKNNKNEICLSGIIEKVFDDNIAKKIYSNESENGYGNMTGILIQIKK